MQKPLCEQDLHRGRDSSLPVLGTRQAGWHECLQGVDLKRLAHRIELAEKTNVSEKNRVPMHKIRIHEGGKDASGEPRITRITRISIT